MEKDKFVGDIPEVVIDFDSSDILSPDSMGIASEVVVETCFEQQEQLENSANASEVSVLQQSLIQEVSNEEQDDSTVVSDDADEAREDKNNPGNLDNDEDGEAVHANSSDSLHSLDTGKSFGSLNHPASAGSILTHRMVTRSASRAKSHLVEVNKIPRKRRSSGGSSWSSDGATPTSSVRGIKNVLKKKRCSRAIRK
uniref:Uncharacterized protein n=1 Tax=Setaria digitata TaxID=48799 RepID=A0A915Q4M9_9BILA